MKKVLCTLIAASLWCNTACADRIIILDENNNFKQEIYTEPSSAQRAAAQTVYTQPQQVIVQQPIQTQEVIVARPRPVVRSYYYDPVATTLFAGFTGAVIGRALFHRQHIVGSKNASDAIIVDEHILRRYACF